MTEIDANLRSAVTTQLAGKRIFIAGDRGMVGSALYRRLTRENAVLLIAHRGVDLTRQDLVESWMKEARPDLVFVAAARVGGILANAERPADFLYQNVMIAANLIEASYRCGVEKLLFLGSSCLYPKFAPQPIPESALLEGALEPTNEAYALAKIAGLKLTETYSRQYGCNFISAMPTSLYGPNDNFDPKRSHVIPALMRRIHEAKVARQPSVEIWGSGAPLREFLHADDMADACVFLMRHYTSPGIINVGAGSDISIKDLASLIAKIVGYQGEFIFDRSKPDGTPRKLLDTARLNALGWKPSIALKEGLAEMYRAWRERAQPYGISEAERAAV